MGSYNLLYSFPFHLSIYFIYYTLLNENNHAFCIHYGVRVERQFMVKSDVSKIYVNGGYFLPGYFYVAHSYFCIALAYFCAVFKFSIFYFRNNICLSFLYILFNRYLVFTNIVSLSLF